MFSVVNVYRDHLKLCFVCIDGRRYVCLLMSVTSPHPALCNLSARTVVKFCVLGVFA